MTPPSNWTIEEFAQPYLGSHLLVNSSRGVQWIHTVLIASLPYAASRTSSIEKVPIKGSIKSRPRIRNNHISSHSSCQRLSKYPVNIVVVVQTREDQRRRRRRKWRYVKTYRKHAWHAYDRDRRKVPYADMMLQLCWKKNLGALRQPYSSGPSKNLRKRPDIPAEDRLNPHGTSVNSLFTSIPSSRYNWTLARLESCRSNFLVKTRPGLGSWQWCVPMRRE
jgi:hypothetical protein